MADRTLFFDDLLSTPNLRAKTYEVFEVTQQGLACIEISGRRLEEWFFARRWVTTKNGRRMLFWLLDEIEAHGYRFHVRRGPVASPGPEDEPWTRASHQWNQLSAEERRIHRELFPEEDRLLRDGYDWDDKAVYRGTEKLPVDNAGRVLEENGATLYEWVKIRDEYTWRRYPLHGISRLVASGAAKVTEPVPGT